MDNNNLPTATGDQNNSPQVPNLPVGSINTDPSGVGNVSAMPTLTPVVTSDNTQMDASLGSLDAQINTGGVSDTVADNYLGSANPILPTVDQAATVPQMSASTLPDLNNQISVQPTDQGYMTTGLNQSSQPGATVAQMPSDPSSVLSGLAPAPTWMPSSDGGAAVVNTDQASASLAINENPSEVGAAISNNVLPPVDLPATFNLSATMPPATIPDPNITPSGSAQETNPLAQPEIPVLAVAQSMPQLDSSIPQFAAAAPTPEQPVLNAPPADSAPTDLSQLANAFNLTPSVPASPASQPIPVAEVNSEPSLVVPTDQVSQSVVSHDSQGVPKWAILIAGLLIILGVSAASMYFILGIGKNDQAGANTSMTPVQQPLTNPPKSTATEQSAAVATISATPAASFSSLVSSATPTGSPSAAPRPSGTSAFDIVNGR